MTDKSLRAEIKVIIDDLLYRYKNCVGIQVWGRKDVDRSATALEELFEERIQRALGKPFKEVVEGEK